MQFEKDLTTELVGEAAVKDPFPVLRALQRAIQFGVPCRLTPSAGPRTRPTYACMPIKHFKAKIRISETG